MRREADPLTDLDPITTEAPELIDRPEAGAVALRGSVLLSGGYALGLLLGLVSAPLLFRHLGVAGFGRYMTVVSLVGLVNGVTEGGLNAMALRQYARSDGEERRVMMRNLLGMRLVLTGIGALAAIAFAVIARYSSQMIAGAVGAAIALLFQAGQNLFQVGLQGDLRFGWVTFTELVRQAVTTALIVALVIAGARLVPLLWVPAPAAIIGLACTAALVRSRLSLRPAFHFARWLPFVRETLPYAIATAIGLAYFRADMIIASLVASSQQVGYYATSFRIIEMLLGIPTLAVGAAYPILSGHQRATACAMTTRCAASSSSPRSPAR